MVQWLRLHIPNAGHQGSIPVQGTRSHVPQLKKILWSQINNYFLLGKKKSKKKISLTFNTQLWSHLHSTLAFGKQAIIFCSWVFKIDSFACFISLKSEASQGQGSYLFIYLVSHPWHIAFSSHMTDCLATFCFLWPSLQNNEKHHTSK